MPGRGRGTGSSRRSKGKSGRGAAAARDAGREDVDVTGVAEGGSNTDEGAEGSVLQGSAETVAASLLDGLPLEVKRLIQLRDALLAENALASDSSAERCACIRSGISSALQLAVGARGLSAAPLLLNAGLPDASALPKTRVEVRQTAGRAVLGQAFTVGRAPECDVQTSGDPTVSRLQFVAVWLPGGIVIADAWSSVGTRMIRRSALGKKLFASLPGQRAAFIVPHGERVVLSIGSRTTVTLGPPDSTAVATSLQPEAVADAAPWLEAAAAATPALAVPASAAAASAAVAPSPAPLASAPMSGPAPGTFAATLAATVVQASIAARTDAADAASASLPPTVPANMPEVAPATVEVPAELATVPANLPQSLPATAPAAPEASEAQAEPGTPDAQGAGKEVQPSTRARGALSRCLHAVQAGVRMQKAVAARERLRWRCRTAKRANLLTAEQCVELEDRLQPPADTSDEVADILDGLGVSMAPDDLMPAGTSTWECPVCRSTERTRGWHCPFQHRFCRNCMVQWAQASALPSCPHAGCGYRLGEHDLEDLRVSETRLEAFRAVQLEMGQAALQEGTQSEVFLFRCQGTGCSAAVVLSTGDERRRYVCACGAPPVCTGCSASPYHYHAKCSEVQPLRARWLAWLQGGREAYQGLQRRAASEATAQQKALREAMARHSELEQDEQWKAENCRLCPKCQKPTEKIDGCNTMVCGQNTHGGNRQPGCGHRFKWQEARPYRPRAEAPRVQSAPALARVGAISGRGVRHLFAQCGLCGSGGQCIVGPRFRCIHCPSFNCCLKCEPRLAAEHEDGHVFEILFEDALDWGGSDIVLPKGTRARIRRRTNGLVSAMDEDENGEPQAASSTGARRTSTGRKRLRQDSGLEGVIKEKKRGRYVLELAGGMGTRHVPPADLQPLLTQRQAERLLVAAAEGGGAALRLRD
mmetsp:Transcript_54626/g.96942  ORF Transcript_54626/g.96942 Transcript_54626/m.96942 type:complete len:933 (-) Transcript_54626:142-2940(-)